MVGWVRCVVAAAWLMALLAARARCRGRAVHDRRYRQAGCVAGRSARTTVALQPWGAVASRSDGGVVIVDWPRVRVIERDACTSPTPCVGMRGDRRRVKVEDHLLGRRARRASKLSVADGQQHPPRGRDPRDVPEQRRLGAERDQVRQAAPAVGHHHRQIAKTRLGSCARYSRVSPSAHRSASVSPSRSATNGNNAVPARDESPVPSALTSTFLLKRTFQLPAPRSPAPTGESRHGRLRPDRVAVRRVSALTLAHCGLADLLELNGWLRLRPRRGGRDNTARSARPTRP
jgi:hypothetical protein